MLNAISLLHVKDFTMEIFVGQSGTVWSYDPSASLGDGGMGQVFKGYSDLHEMVAVKRIPLTRIQSERAGRSEREIVIGSLLASTASAKHVVKMKDWAETAGSLFIVMPMASGSLNQMMSSTGYPEDSSIEILKQITLGLVDLESQKIVHRDLKPANILKLDGLWKLADFGISRDLKVDTSSLTYKGFGTYAYMAPEVWEWSPVTHKTDLYALGVIAYELLEGAKPFGGPTENDFSNQHRTQAPPPMQKTSATLKTLVLNLLAKKPGARVQDATGVLNRLNSLASPGRANLSGLQAARAVRQQQLTAQEAASALENQKAMEHSILMKDANEALDRLLETIVEEIKFEISDITFSVDKRGTRFIQSKEVQVEIQTGQYWPKEPSAAADTLILVGTLYVRSIRGFPVANLVCEYRDGRFEWKILQFQVTPGVLNYELGPQGEPHGFTQMDFATQRPYMLRTMRHIWTMTSSTLNIDNLLPIFEDAIRRQG